MPSRSGTSGALCSFPGNLAGPPGSTGIRPLMTPSSRPDNAGPSRGTSADAPLLRLLLLALVSQVGHLHHWIRIALWLTSFRRQISGSRSGRNGRGKLQPYAITMMLLKQHIQLRDGRKLSREVGSAEKINQLAREERTRNQQRSGREIGRQMMTTQAAGK